MSRSAKLHWLISCCSVLLASLLFSATLDADSITSPAFNAVSQALFISLACYLLLPSATNLKGLVINSSSGVVVFIVLSRMPLTTGIPLAILLKLCVVIFCLGLLLWSLTQLLEHLFPGTNGIRITVILLTTIITSSPLWLGPVADIYQAGDVIVDSVVSVTPLTHFSVAAEYDYLRSEWMYQNSAFGSLPFAYPDITGITACYFLFVLIVQLILRGVTRHPRF